MSPRLAVQAQRDHLRSRILQEFERRAAHEGPRGVVMAELARDLGISTRTLYQVFESKAELVRAIMEDWATEVEVDGQRRLAQYVTVPERIREGSLSLVEGQSRFSRAFWSQVRRDFPEATAVLNRQLTRSLGHAAKMVVDALRDDVLPGHALPLLMKAIEQASEPSLCNRLGISRRESVTRAVEIWCRGALAPEVQEKRPSAPPTLHPRPA